MEYEFFNDRERSLLYSALNREKKVCEEIDKSTPGDGINLTPVVDSIFYKFKLLRTMMNSYRWHSVLIDSKDVPHIKHLDIIIKDKDNNYYCGYFTEDGRWYVPCKGYVENVEKWRFLEISYNYGEE